MTEAAQALDLESIVRTAGDADSKEVTTNAFIGYLVDTLSYTYETARDMIYRLIELGRFILTNRYTLRLA